MKIESKFINFRFFFSFLIFCLIVVSPLEASEDTDYDGIINTADNCPSMPNGPNVGTCFEGSHDGNNCLNDDECKKSQFDPAVCNKGQEDSDGDGIGNVCDNCPYNANVNQTDNDSDDIGDVCDVDDDNDGISDTNDNCPFIANGPDGGVCAGGDAIGKNCTVHEECAGDGYCSLNQEDFDSDGIGDVCEEDYDGDGVLDNTDNCIWQPNGNLLGTCIYGNTGASCLADSDCGTGRVEPGSCNNNQEDLDGDNIGDICDTCMFDPDNDIDNDHICGDLDNCPNISNQDQKNTDRENENRPGYPPGDDLGDVCDPDNDNDGYCDPDITDISCSGIDNCPLIYNLSQINSDRDTYGDHCDNCPYNTNEDQRDQDNDGVGNGCDNCRFIINPNQEDNDSDCRMMPFTTDPHCGDLCDNCIDDANTQQEDWDGDGVGDACDCSDNFWGPNEDGADCGGSCEAICPDSCVPVITNGDSLNKIDLVFMRSTDSIYDDMSMFREHLMEVIENSFYANSTIENHKNAINFWYIHDRADVYAIDPNLGCIRNVIPTWQFSCSGGELGAIIHTLGGNCRSFSFAHLIDSSFDNPITLIHESGHGLFGLADEYDDAPECYTSYHDGGNIFRRKNICEEKTRSPNNPSDCVEFTTCLDPFNRAIERLMIWPWETPDGWWKAQPANTIMRCCPAGATGCDWGPDAVKQVEDKLHDFSTSYSFSSIESAPSLNQEGISATGGGEQKAIICNLHFDGEIVEKSDCSVVYGPAPNRYLNWDGLNLKVLNLNNDVVFDFTISDPRYIDYVDPPGAELLEEADFTVVFPFFENVKTLSVADGKYQAFQYNFDLTETVLDFCEEFPDDPQCLIYPPSVRILIPANEVALQDGTTLTAEVQGPNEISVVYFYIREPNGAVGKPIGQEFLSASLNNSNGLWEYNFNTTMLEDGYYVILAMATDVYGNEAWSTLINFSIRNWAVFELLPSSESNKAGRAMPVKFSLRIAESVDPNMPFVYNEDLEIRIFNTSNPGNIMQTSHYGDSSKDYRIGSEKYITNFKTTKKPAEYSVEIWRMNKNWEIGSFTFETVK